MELREQLQQTLGSAYQLERELSGGGMSRIFVATESALARKVVVKVLSPELAVGVSAQRFAREIRLAASLQQANVVPVLTTGETNGLPYYTMPFVDGRSLGDRLARDGPLAVPEAVAVLRDVARALSYAHARGVVHRDIKPGNVLLSGAAAVVTDFGIAKAISLARGEAAGHDGITEVTEVGMAIGTPAYMAPEQIAGDPGVDHRADLYSFGCLAYEALSGRPPFESRSRQQLIASHLGMRPAHLAEHCPDCPQQLVQLVMQCLEKDPDHRPASADQVLRRLDVVPTSSNRLTRFRNRISLMPRAAVLAAASVLVAALLTIVTVRHASEPNTATTVTSLAVLPFLNIGGDSTRDVWADALTDEITTLLARLPGLRLASRTAVGRYRGLREVSPADAGGTLQVQQVLQGTLWPVGSRVRVQAWLSDASTGDELWRDRFEHEAGDILAVLDSVTGGITMALERRLIGEADSSLGTAVRQARGTSDTLAYQLFLQGEAMLHARAGGVRRAAQLFELAAERDPGFARAHGALSAALEVLPYFTDTTFAEVHDRAVAAARRALTIDPSLAQAHGTLALASMHAFEWAAADSQFRLALALDPDDAFTHMHHGRLLAYTGRLTDAVREMERAWSLDPTSPVIGGWLAKTLLLVGRKSEAFAQIDRALELDSTSVPIAYFGADISLARGQRERARALAEISWRPMGVPRTAPWLAAATLIYAGLGDTAPIAEIMRLLEAEPRSRTFGHSAIAVAALAVGDTARTLDELELATDAGEFWPSAPILALPALDLLRSNQRFANLVRRVGLDVDLFTSPTGGRPQ